jgi:hypothetical protein
MPQNYFLGIKKLERCSLLGMNKNRTERFLPEISISETLYFSIDNIY